MTLVQTCDADVAILDINLGDGMVYPAADILAARGIPIIFATGYATEKALLTRYAKARFLQKPYGVAAVLKLVTQSFEAAPLLGG
jgi:CheY-like chemotaxis protein